MNPRPSRLRAYLALGRVSNLPTVWTNVGSGLVLSRAPLDGAVACRLVASMSLFYVAGMFLNDAFDREIDRVERPTRPIPSGAVGVAEVFAVGFALMGAGLGIVLWNRAVVQERSWGAPGAAFVLGGLIVLYDAWHKKNPLSPVVMGACRAMIYLTAALAAGGFIGPTLRWAALALAGYVVGLTFVARQENRKSYRAGGTLGLLSLPGTMLFVAPAGPVALAAAAGATAWVVASVWPLFRDPSPNVGRSVVRLIAGISLVDALFVAPLSTAMAGACALGFAATLGLQRWVSGT